MKITSDDIFHFNFYTYKKPFKGSLEGMRYRIRMQLRENGTDGDGKPLEEKYFEVSTWPEPYCYEATDPSLITVKEFPFDEDGYNGLIQYLNDQLPLYKEQLTP